ncbi:MAG: PAS domain S-box protein [Sneathiella sp.]|nr:PAS domain S-box protein [Sneathiella sp.]
MLVRNKIIILVLCLVSTATIAVSYFSFQHTTDVARRSMEDLVLSTLKITTEKLLDNYQVMYGDSLLLSNTPEMKRLTQSIASQAEQELPTPASTLAVKELLESVLLSRPFYTQLRVISVRHSGQEWVRLNRSLDGIELVTEDALQIKSREPYYRNSQRLLPGTVYISDVTLNREEGHIDPSLTPTIRMVYPLFSEGRLTAFIVINADFEKLAEQSFKNVSTFGNIFIDTRYGNYLKLDKAGSITKHFETSETVPEIPEIFKIFQNQTSDQNVVYLEDKVGFWIQQSIDFSGPNVFLNVYEEIENEVAFASVKKAQKELIWLVLALITTAMVLAFLLSRQFTLRLQLMTESLSNAKETGDRSNLYLPIGDKDEIGTLANAFAELYDDLSESEQNANALIEGTLDGIIACDKAGNILRYNAACAKIFGYPLKEALGLNLSSLLIKIEQDLDGGSRSVTLDVPAHFISGLRQEMVAMQKDGKRKPLEVAVSEVRTSDDAYFICIIRDISLQEEAKREIRQLIDGLQRSNQELENFAHVASHDLKEPLRAISNHTVFLEEDYSDQLDEGGRKRLARIRVLITKMNGLISDLLHYSRITKVQEAMGDFDMAEIVEDAVSLLAEVAEEKGAEINIEKNLPTIYCEQVRITEVIRNLVSNALKYSGSSPPQITIGCRKEATPVFFVKDNGIGIPSEHHEDVFRMFKRLVNSKNPIEGTGAGLSFAKRIIENHGGRIWIESEENKGTTVLFTIGPKRRRNTDYERSAATSHYH